MLNLGPIASATFRKAQDLWACQRGVVAQMLALMIAVVLICGGAAIDYLRSAQAVSKLQAALDAAALAAAANPTYSDDKFQSVARAYFDRSYSDQEVEALAVQISRTKMASGANQVQISATGQLPTSFLRLAGLNTLPVAASASANSKVREVATYVAVDMSASMGLAADPAARAALEALTAPYLPSANPPGCEFACHQADGWEPAGKTVYTMAKAAGIPLREDVLNQAFQRFVDGYLGKAKQVSAIEITKVGVIGFSDTAQLLQAPSDNPADVKGALSAYPANAHLNTLMTTVLPQIRDMVGPQGNGAPGSPVKTLVLVTDGLPRQRNVADPINDHPLDATLCDAFKNDGISVVVVDVKYLDSTGETWFDAQVKPYYDEISPALQACASPGLYFQAEDSDIDSLNDSFATVMSALKGGVALTQ